MSDREVLGVVRPDLPHSMPKMTRPSFLALSGGGGRHWLEVHAENSRETCTTTCELRSTGLDAHLAFCGRFGK
jgi:hypothetical protein